MVRILPKFLGSLLLNFVLEILSLMVAKKKSFGHWSNAKLVGHQSQFKGGRGDDVLIGGAGDDTVVVSDGDDVVTYGGNSYTYINVTAGAGTNPDSTSHWSLMTRGITLRGDWDAATQYVAGDIAKLNGIHYKCKATTTNNIPPNSTYWEEFIQGFNYTGNWSSATQYRKNDIAIQNGVNYKMYIVLQVF